MNDAEEQLAQRLALDLERVLGPGIPVECVEIGGDGPVIISVACLVGGGAQEIQAAGPSALEAISTVIRLAAELRLSAAFRELSRPA